VSNLRPLLLYDTGRLLSRSNGPTYTTYVNDGVALLQRVTEPNEAILTMDAFNPFPYAMGRRPPLGGIAAMAYHYTLSDGHRAIRRMRTLEMLILSWCPSDIASEDKYYIDFGRLTNRDFGEDSDCRGFGLVALVQAYLRNFEHQQVGTKLSGPSLRYRPFDQLATFGN